MVEKFKNIYASNSWRNGSGEGSSPTATSLYRLLLQTFLLEHSVTRIIDLGCGDWQFSKYIDWGNRTYLGIDIVPSVIEFNRKHYAKDGISFQCSDASLLDTNLHDADLVLIKDVLQHWSQKTIEVFLPRLQKYQYTLVTNSMRVGIYQINRPIDDGGFSPIDLLSPPMADIIERSGLNISLLLDYNAFGNDKKQVCLLVPRNAQTE